MNTGKVKQNEACNLHNKKIKQLLYYSRHSHHQPDFFLFLDTDALPVHILR